MKDLLERIQGGEEPFVLIETGEPAGSTQVDQEWGVSAALLAAIAARPDDDGPRLVYADALSEQQDPRGEFILLQCQAARLPSEDPKRAELAQRAKQLLDQHRAAWSPAGLEWQFDRGFPFFLQVHVSQLREHLAAIHAAWTLRSLEVRFTSAEPGDLIGLLTFPVLQRVRSLSFNWHTPHHLAIELLAEPWIAKLERLQFSWAMLPQPFWQVLGRAESHARQIPELDLMLSDARDDFVRLLDPAPWPRLRWLRLANGRLGTRGCELLAQPGLFPALEHLDVSWNRIGKQGAALLARSPLIHQLTGLDLSHCQIGDDGCLAIAEARPRALRTLRLDNSRVTEKGLEALRTAIPGLRIIS